MTAQTVSNAVAERDTGPITLMWDKKRHFEVVLPGSVDVTSFLGTAAGALYGNADLMRAAQANPDSLMIALMECASLGHRPGTDEYYLTPRKDHGRPKILGIEGYRGIVERMYRSGAVAKVVVREVCAKDYFEYTEGQMDRPVHHFGGTEKTGAGFFGKDGSRDRGDMVGVYAYAELTGGAVSRVVLLSRTDVHAARDAGGYKPDDKFSPWNRLDGGKDHPEFTGRSMWWKTAARRLEPWVPTSAEYRREQLRASAAAASTPVRQPAEMPAPAAPPEEPVDAEIVDDAPELPAAEPQKGPRSARRQASQNPSPASAPHAPAAAQAPQDASGDPAGGGGHAPQPAAPAQVTMILTAFERLGYGEDDQAAILRTTARLAGLDDLAGLTQLTTAEATTVMRALDKVTDANQLQALIEDGEAAR